MRGEYIYKRNVFFEINSSVPESGSPLVGTSKTNDTIRVFLSNNEKNQGKPLSLYMDLFILKDDLI